MDLKHKILSNTFVEQVRNGFVVDENEYEILCSLLVQLENELKDKTQIDKDLAQDLYIIPYVTKNMAEALRRNARNESEVQKADMIQSKAEKLDDLVLSCLAS